MATQTTQVKGFLKKQPILALTVAGIAVYGTYRTLKYFNLITEKFKKLNCNSANLSMIDPFDFVPYDREDVSEAISAAHPIALFNPDKFAANLFECYSGFTYAPNSCNIQLEIISKHLTDNDLKCFHNAWRSIISKTESPYNFISGQKPYPGTDEEELKSDALITMSAAGLKNVYRE